LVTTIVTETFWGALVAPDELIVIVSVYVPEARPDALTETVRFPDVEPEAGESVSHEAVFVAVQFKTPVPSL
jgi:hypothetical protein